MRVKEIILNNYNIIGNERKLQIDYLTIGSYDEVDAFFKYVSRHEIEYKVDNISIMMTPSSSSNDKGCDIKCSDSLNFKKCWKFFNDLYGYFHMKDQDYKNPLVKSALNFR